MTKKIAPAGRKPRKPRAPRPKPANHDVDIRRALYRVLLASIPAGDVRVVDELSIAHGNSRVDVAVIGDCLHGYEIKSAADTLNRLRRQIEDYNRVFDRMTLVVDQKHAEVALQIIPSWWGVIQARSDGEHGIVLERLRHNEPNPAVQRLMQLNLLWRTELEVVVRRLGIMKTLKRRTVFFLRRALLDHLGPDKSHQVVCSVLRVRRSYDGLAWRPAVPKCLQP